MTDQRDALVAEAIEPKPIEPAERLSPRKAWYPTWKDESSPSKGYLWLPRPFISAPTWPLEGIVLEWVQEEKIFPKWSLKLVSMVSARYGKVGKDLERMGLDSVWWIKHNKLGDWARALLEVLTKNK